MNLALFAPTDQVNIWEETSKFNPLAVPFNCDKFSSFCPTQQVSIWEGTSKLNPLAVPFNCGIFSLSRCTRQATDNKDNTTERNCHVDSISVFTLFILVLSSYIVYSINMLFILSDTTEGNMRMNSNVANTSNTSRNICNGMSYINDNLSNNPQKHNDSMDPLKLLRDIKISNLNRLIIGQLNINSLRNKFEALKSIIKDNIDILIITESELDDTFPTNQFRIDGYAPPFRIDRNKTGGGVIIYVREDIPSIELNDHPSPLNFECIYFLINLRKTKCLIFGGYNPNKLNIHNFGNKLGPILDYYMPIYDNLILLGDFNS